jgi:Holliday junction resolvasome RuvABC endonuclease subunit
MKLKHAKHLRVVAITPSYRGFGYAVLDGDALVDWGVKSVSGDKNARCLEEVEDLIAHYLPKVIVLQDHSGGQSRRSDRIRELSSRIVAVASSLKLRVAVYSDQQVKQAYFADGRGTKHAIAKILAARFHEELGFRLPPKRRPWMGQDYRMGIFDALALALLAAPTASADPRPDRGR